MNATDREVAGIRCSEVLDDLSDYFDDELPAARVAQIEAHLGGCDWCERFGGDFAGAIAALRARLGSAPEVPAALHDRLMNRIPEE